MIRNSINSICLIFAYKKGYRISKEGNVLSFTGEIIKPRINSNGYFVFGFRTQEYGSRGVLVHQLQAYQKYGDKLFECDCVRHLNGDKLNNYYDNILIGTSSDNQMDRSKEDRIRSATIASHSYKLKYNDDEVIKIKKHHEMYKSYGKTMKVFGITSKGTLYFILNKR